MRYAVRHECNGKRSSAFDRREQATACIIKDAIIPCTDRCLVVRVLSPAETRRKREAAVLRRVVSELRRKADEFHNDYSEVGIVLNMSADEYEREADALWPRRTK